MPDDSLDQLDDGFRREDAYEMYGGGGGDGDTPGLPRDQQISSQKMLTPNEQRMHQSYFPNEMVEMRGAQPSTTKSYQAPMSMDPVSGFLSGSAPTANPFAADHQAEGHGHGQAAGTRMPFGASVGVLNNDETNSVSTAHPQHYYYRQQDG